jgi:hypothetical protein
MDEGHSKLDAIRALKRYLAREVSKPTSTSSRSASIGASTHSTRSSRCSASWAAPRLLPVPTSIPAHGNTLHLVMLAESNGLPERPNTYSSLFGTYSICVLERARIDLGWLALAAMVAKARRSDLARPANALTRLRQASLYAPLASRLPSTGPKLTDASFPFYQPKLSAKALFRCRFISPINALAIRLRSAKQRSASAVPPSHISCVLCLGPGHSV